MKSLARWRGRHAVIGVPYLWLLVFFLLPFGIVLRISVSEMDAAQFNELLTLRDGVLQLTLKLSNYVFLFDDDLYLRTYLASLKYAAVTTLLCLAIGYPFAYFMARARTTLQPTLLMLVMLPFWTSFLLRVYAWMGLLDSSEVGLINQMLLGLGVVAEPLPLLYNRGAVLLGMVYSYLPFMVLPLYANLVKLDLRLLEAACDLGARPLTVFVRITLPLSWRGIVAGSMLVFIPAVGEFVIPDLLGGGSVLTIGRRIWDDFGPNQDWPMAAAVAVIMVLMLIAPVMLLHRRGHGREAGQ